jgi:hypothetical protein
MTIPMLVSMRRIAMIGLLISHPDLEVFFLDSGFNLAVCGDRKLALRCNIGLYFLEECIPEFAIRGSISPVSVDCSSRTLALTEYEERATFTTSDILRCLM